jgi:hypothetical protein
MDDKDVWRAADLLIKQHGDEAEFFAVRRVDDMIERGDPVGEAVWKLIPDAIRALRRPRGDVLN